MLKRITVAIAASTIACAPALAQELSTMAPNSTLFYVSIPLDGKTRKESVPNFGFAMRGSRDYQVVNFNDRMVDNMIAHLEGSGFGIETAWLVVGGIAATAAVAVAGAGKSSTQQQQTQQQQTQQQQLAAQQGGSTGATGGTGSTGGTSGSSTTQGSSGSTTTASSGTGAPTPSGTSAPTPSGTTGTTGGTGTAAPTAPCVCPS